MAAKFKMAGANGYGGDWPKNEQYTVDLFFGWINVFIPSSLKLKVCDLFITRLIF